MPLRGKPPEAIQKRLKALFYGAPGVGKTRTAIQFPYPYLIDTERGAENSQYVEALKKSGGAYFSTTDPEELITEITALLSEKHPYKTLVIDPLTIIYNDLIDKYSEELGTDFGRHKIPADRKIKHLMTLLLRLDMNVIITSHAKPKWSRAKDSKGKETIIEDGQTFDCYGKLDYLFDLVFEVQKRGKSCIGLVKKTRVEGFPEGEQFPFTYEEIANRYGRDILERDAKPEELATVEQISEAKRLVTLLKIPQETVNKWLEKASAISFNEMSAVHIQKCINLLLNKLKGESE